MSRECALKDSTTVSATCNGHPSMPTDRLSVVKNSLNGKQPNRNHKNPPRSSQELPRSQYSKCKHCRRNNHPSHDCFFKSTKCNLCHQQGHIKPICPRSLQRRNPRVHHLETEENSDDNIDGYLKQMKVVPMYKQTTALVDPYYVTLQVNSKALRMEIDKGASVSVISKKDLKYLGIK